MPQVRNQPQDFLTWSSPAAKTSLNVDIAFSPLNALPNE
jgi:hypothetical protein